MKRRRHETVVFVDLDGTLTLHNSFHVFVLAVWTLATPRVRAALALAFAERFVLRRGRIVMKRRVLEAFERLPCEVQRVVVERTVAELAAAWALPVLRVLDDLRKEGARVVLATAAPSAYAEAVASEFKMDGHVSTPPVGTDPGGWVECFGEEKARACRDWLRANSYDGVRVVAVSDHCDDLPLLRLADKAVLQAGPARSREICERLGPHADVRMIDPHAPQPGGGLWLWVKNRLSGPHDEWEVRTVLSKHRHALLYVGGQSWRRLLPGSALGDGVRRVDPPALPMPRQRVAIETRRRLVRDVLGVYH